jgi:hypothetical protein
MKKCCVFFEGEKECFKYYFDELASEGEER